MRKPRTIDKTIYDQALHKQGFLGFSASSVVSGGKAIAFSYPSGMRYIVPLEYILSWFGGSGRGEEPYSAARSRRLSGGHLVRLYLSDGKHVDVAWDTVLMACEPLYEHYCGLTEESKALTKRWKPNFGNLSSMKVRPGRSARRLLFDLSALFASPILDADECLVISRESDVFRHALSFPGDPVGFEAFVNHVHLDDTLASAAVKLSRKDLCRIGELVVQVWSDRLKALLRGREVLFYLGGPRGVTLRFHVVREESANWLDLHDKRFIQKEKIRIFRLNEAGLSEEAA